MNILRFEEDIRQYTCPRTLYNRSEALAREYLHGRKMSKLMYEEASGIIREQIRKI